MRVVKGAVRETQYRREEETQSLTEIACSVANEGQVAFIHGTQPRRRRLGRHRTPPLGSGCLRALRRLTPPTADSIALHKVANPSEEETACTLHLYAPPFRRCKLWTDPSDATKVLEPVITHYSEHGRKVEYC